MSLAGVADVEILHVQVNNAGGARAAGVRHMLADTNDPATVWLANTDADSLVPMDWLTEMIADAERGVEVVLGTVEPDDELDESIRTAWLGRHNLVEGHRHVHGANFGIRADIYRGLGGWLTLPHGEDVALAARAVEANATIRRTARIPVITCSRLRGRSVGGFADYLTDLARKVAHLSHVPPRSRDSGGISSNAK